MNIDRDTYEKIITDSINAPSGDNSQPWSFAVNVLDNTIDLFGHPEKDNPILNIYNGGTLVACGAMIENLIISARAHGYITNLEVMPSGPDSNKYASIKLVGRCLETNSDQISILSLRTTNRREYKKVEFTEDFISELLQKGQEFGGLGIGLKLFSNISEKRQLANIASAVEQIALENKSMHHHFFKDILWDRTKARSGSPGLYIKTLELPGPIELLFRGLSSWNFTTLLNKIGFSRFASSVNAKKYSRSSVIGVISISNYEPENFLYAGRLLEKIWLMVNSRDGAFHLITGSTFLMIKNKNSAEMFLEKNHREIVYSIENKLKDLVCIDKQGTSMPVLIFRAGYANSPSARSVKKYPEINFY